MEKFSGPIVGLHPSFVCHGVGSDVGLWNGNLRLRQFRTATTRVNESMQLLGKVQSIE